VGAVTAHVASIDHDALLNFVAAEHLDWSADQGATDIHDGNIAETGVTQHEAALAITESQITDLHPYPLRKAKAADETVTSSTAVQDDDHLVSFALEASSRYLIRGTWRVSCASAVPDMKFQIASTQALTDSWMRYLSVNDGGTIVGDARLTITSNLLVTVAATNEHIITIDGYVETGGSAPTLKLRWAQQTSDASGVTLHEGSSLSFTKME
jgi:hypothetical protein